MSWEDGIKFANALSQRLGLQPVYKGTDNNAQLVRGATGFRLLSEAEWAWSARCGEDYNYAGSDDLNTVGWYSGNSRGQTYPVGLKQANACGLKDMSGNVLEWTVDDFSTPGQHSSGAARRVFRGGSWNYDAGGCRVSYRYMVSPDIRNLNFGLRFSRPLD